MQLSASALSNNIGAILYSNGEIDEATSRFHDCINDAHCETKKAGLAWFLRKLQRQSVAFPSKEDHHVGVNGANGHHLTTTCTRRGSIAEAVLTHEEFCDQKTPLGFEYFYEPITVYDNTDVKAAAWMNLAFLQYSSSAKLETVRKTLEKAKPTTPFMKAIQRNNLGVLYFRLSQTKMALDCFVEASARLDEFRIEKSASPWKTEEELSSSSKIHKQYIQMSVLLNYARICVRLNNAKKATALVDELDTLVRSIPHHSHVHNALLNRMRWISNVAKFYIMGMIHQRQENLTTSLELYREFLQKARHDLGHDHLHVATVLYLKGMVLFDQRKLHHAMLAQLASLRIHESHQDITGDDDGSGGNKPEMARVMYSVARTLHDREEFTDALRMYNRTLQLQKELAWKQQECNISVDVVTTLCNVARVHHIIGDIDACLRDNYEIVSYAKQLSGGKKHPFVADRLVVLGNVLVEAGKMEDAMKAFADAARVSGDGENGVRSSPFDVDARSAASLAKAGLQHPGAATA
jgi:tetratricopeptide (TPR) repeat protein